MPPRRCSSFWAALALLAAPSRLLGSNAGATIQGRRRATNASNAQPGAASSEVVRWLPAPDRRRRLSDYAQRAKLTASDAASGDSFGRSVGIYGDTVVVGTYSKEAAYVFRTTDGGATYVEVAKLTAADAASGDGFGKYVAIDGDTIVVGAPGAGTGGTVYIFSTTDG